MAISTIERITMFENQFAKAQATDIVDLSWGFAVLQADFPLSHYHNRIVITDPAAAQEILETVEEVLSGAGIRHRYLSVDNDNLGQTLTAEFEAAGYEHETIAAMVYSGPEVEPVADEVQVVSLDRLRPAIIRDWRTELPSATDETLMQLADRTALYSRGAELTLLAIAEGDEIAAHATLCLDRTASIAQFENLVTSPAFRGRGYGGALVRDALGRGHQASCELSFLTAGLTEWPYEWYQRLGYVDAGRTHHFRRETGAA